MITLKQESVLVKKLKSLTELELQAVFQELADHIQANKMSDMVDTVFQIPDLYKQINDLDDELDEVRAELSGRESMCQRASTVLECIENLDDDIQKEIDKAIEILNEN